MDESRRRRMNTNPANDPDPELRKLLGEWKIEAGLPPRFEERVWRRMDSSETGPATAGGLIGWLAALPSFLARPGLAASYVTALLLLGFAVGWARGQEKSARIDHDLSARYVQEIDPYHMVHSAN